MTTMIVTLLLLTLITCVFSSDQSTIDDRCYKNVSSNLDDFLNRYKDPPNATIPDQFIDYSNAITRIKTLFEKIKKPNELKRKLDDIRRKLNQTRNELVLIETGEELLKEIQLNAMKLEEQRKYNNDTRKECSTLDGKYKKLEKDYKEIERQGNKIKTTIDKINSAIAKTNADSIKIKEKVDSLKIPDYLTETYFCDKNIFDTFQQIIKTSREIRRIIDQLKDKILMDLANLTKRLKSLEEPENLPDLLLTEKELKNDIKNFKPELIKVQKLQNLIKRKNTAITDMEDVKNHACYLLNTGVCFLQRRADVEI